MKLAKIAAATLTLAAAGSHAAAPTATVGGDLTTFAEFVASGPAVGDNGVNVKNTLFWIDEAVAGGMKSYYLFYDPRGTGHASAQVTFAGAISAVLVSQGDLAASEAMYGKAGVDYAYDGGGLTGLEMPKGRKACDSADDHDCIWVSGNTLTLNWKASNPGDHVRVLTVVPEPSTYALMGAGLLAIGLFASRRRRED